MWGSEYYRILERVRRLRYRTPIAQLTRVVARGARSAERLAVLGDARAIMTCSDVRRAGMPEEPLACRVLRVMHEVGRRPQHVAS